MKDGKYNGKKDAGRPGKFFGENKKLDSQYIFTHNAGSVSSFYGKWINGFGV